MKAQKKIISQNSKVENISYRRRISQYYSRFTTAIKLILVSIILILILTKQFSAVVLDIRFRIAETFAEAGFVLENVSIAGQKNISNHEVIESLNADTGTPIFLIDLDECYNRLISNPWVRSAIIQRKLPNTISVSLYEKDAIAIWQINKELHVVDSEGDVIKGIKAEKFSNLIHIVGEDANIYAYELVHSLSSNPELAGKIQYAVRYGQRRWDINFEENINVKMPQYEFISAYEYLSKLYQEKKLFGSNIKTIDLRDMKKIYIEKLK